MFLDFVAGLRERQSDLAPCEASGWPWLACALLGGCPLTRASFGMGGSCDELGGS